MVTLILPGGTVLTELGGLFHCSALIAYQNPCEVLTPPGSFLKSAIVMKFCLLKAPALQCMKPIYSENSTMPYGILKDLNKTSLRITIQMCLTTKNHNRTSATTYNYCSQLYTSATFKMQLLESQLLEHSLASEDKMKAHGQHQT